jgi:hypothetical protein
MIAEGIFSRWVVIGLPAILLEGVILAVLLHLCYRIAWNDLLFPLALCLVIQIGLFLSAFWTGKLAREKGRYGPISLLVGLSSWGTLLIAMHYGRLWKVLPAVGSAASFSIFMVFVTSAAWFVMSKTSPKK